MLRESWQLIKAGDTQAQKQRYDLSHSSIHLICDLLEHVRRVDLQIQSCQDLHGAGQHQGIQEESQYR